MGNITVQTTVDHSIKLFVKLALILLFSVIFNANSATIFSENSNIIDRNINMLTNSEINNYNEFSNKVSQQNKKTIKGVILDEANIPIIGANVIETGTSNGTVSDLDGAFSLEVDENASIKITYIGYLDQDINVQGRTDFRIILQEDMKTLEEVVVVGYGTMRKSDLTGSISTIKEDLINLGFSTTPDQALRGKVSGVQITSTSGQPGAGNIIRVRGTTSILGSNDPLYVCR